MALTDKLADLEKHVNVAQELQKKMESAQDLARKAEAEFAAASGKIEALRQELHETLGNLFGASDRVRSSK